MKITKEQIENFNYNQHHAPLHPLTCPGNKPECKDQRELIATEDCLVCACGEYKQAFDGWMGFVLNEKQKTFQETIEEIKNENKSSE